MKIEFYYKIIKDGGSSPEEMLDFLITQGFTLFEMRDNLKKYTKDELIQKYLDFVGGTDLFCIRNKEFL